MKVRADQLPKRCACGRTVQTQVEWDALRSDGTWTDPEMVGDEPVDFRRCACGSSIGCIFDPKEQDG